MQPIMVIKQRTTITADIFNRITRYTRLVFVGKWALAGVSIVIILSIVAIPLVEQSKAGKRISFVSTHTTGTDHPVMLQPKLQGTTDNNEPFTVTAARAVQESETLVRIYEVQADLFKRDNSWLNLTADQGMFNSEARSLTLTGKVSLYQDQGYSFVTERVDIDTRRAAARGDGLIQGQGPLGNLTATGYVVEDNGAHMRFGNKGINRVLVRIQK
jgi:lipopolysaccharide export system protein LptC